jgi:hypothetical protein
VKLKLVCLVVLAAEQSVSMTVPELGSPVKAVMIPLE